MPASVLWRPTVFHFFCEKRRHSRNSSRHSQKSLSASSRTTALGPGYPFWELLSAFLMPFSSQSEKWKMQRRLSENPPFSDLEGHFFEPFPASIRKRSHNIPSLPFLWDFSIFLALPGDVPEPTKTKNTKTLQKRRFGKYYRHSTVCLWTK